MKYRPTDSATEAQYALFPAAYFKKTLRVSRPLTRYPRAAGANLLRPSPPLLPLHCSTCSTIGSLFLSRTRLQSFRRKLLGGNAALGFAAHSSRFFAIHSEFSHSLFSPRGIPQGSIRLTRPPLQLLILNLRPMRWGRRDVSPPPGVLGSFTPDRNRPIICGLPGNLIRSGFLLS
jgi:hypothetical protein